MTPSSRRLLATAIGLGLVGAPMQGLGGPGAAAGGDAGDGTQTRGTSGASAAKVPGSLSVTTVGATTKSAVPTRSYVVNVGTGAAIAPGRAQTVRSAITRAGGTVVQEWPQIGVVVAHSTRADFATRLQPSAATRITGVGPTRTVPVTETLHPVRKPAGQRTPVAVPASGTAAEPREREQWGLRTVRADASGGRPAAAFVAPAALAQVTVAVVDSGIEADHPDLRGAIDTAASLDCSNGGRPDSTATRWRNTDNGHGTHVAGIIAAARNGVGVAGVAPGVRVASVKVANDSGFIYPEYAICGVMSLAKGVRVANHSYFVDPWRYWCSTDKRQAAAREAVRRAFDYSRKAGVLNVAAAGNEGADLARKVRDDTSPGDGAPVSRTLNGTCLDLPTELPGVVTVAAADPNGAISAYSNYGRGVIDVMAPGTEVLSAYPDRSWALLSGTSMAAPHASGVAALLAARTPRATPGQLSALLLRQARDVRCPRGDRRCTGTTARNSLAGEGMVDASRAVGR